MRRTATHRSPLPLWAAVSAILLGAAGIGCTGKPAAGGPPSAPPVAVTTAPVVQKPMPVQLKAIGTVEAYSTVAVKTQVSGPILKVHFSEGQEVSRGQTLFTIDPAPFEATVRRAEAALARTRANLERDRALWRNAEADVKRYEELVAKDYVTRQQYDTVKANAEALQATLQADEASVRADEAELQNARLDLGYCTVIAPVTGRSGELLVHAGNMARLNDTILVQIYQVRPIYVDFTVPEQVLPRLRDHLRRGRLNVSAIVPDSGASAESGTVTFLDSTVASGTGTIHLKATFDNTGGVLWPGLFVDVLVVLDTEPLALVVPAQAVIPSQEGTLVYIVAEDGTVAVRKVTVSRIMSGEAVISDGLRPGDTIVVDGQMRLIPGARIVVRQKVEPEVIQP
jgi:multidrug efflux system membrane fusion protein